MVWRLHGHNRLSLNANKTFGNSRVFIEPILTESIGPPLISTVLYEEVGDMTAVHIKVGREEAGQTGGPWDRRTMGQEEIQTNSPVLRLRFCLQLTEETLKTIMCFLEAWSKTQNSVT